MNKKQDEEVERPVVIAMIMMSSIVTCVAFVYTAIKLFSWMMGAE